MAKEKKEIKKDPKRYNKHIPKEVVYRAEVTCKDLPGVLVESATVERKTGKGCTKEEAERDLDRQLLDLAEIARQPVGQCHDATCDHGDCILYLSFRGNWELRFHPARLSNCSDKTGYLCYRRATGENNFMQCLCGCFI